MNTQTHDERRTAAIDAAVRYLAVRGLLDKLAVPVPILGRQQSLLLPPIVRWRQPLRRKATDKHNKRNNHA